MYTEKLEEKKIKISQIYLDPNNPRFWKDTSSREIPDSRITQTKIQAVAQKSIEAYGIRELRDSILRNGFLCLDRIVVRPIERKRNSFVIVEGNRRFAALTKLREEIQDGTVNEDGVDEDYVETLRRDTDRIDVLIYRGDDTHDISWLLQGIRHIGGIRPWAPAQRARLVVEQIDNHGLTFKSAGQTFGLTAQQVGRLYRAYKGLEQMKEDGEFSGKAQNDYFTLFEEAYRNKHVRNWLGWNNAEYKYEDEDNLRQFYSWISEDEERSNSRRIHDPRQIKTLGALVEGEHSELMNQVDEYEIDMEQVKAVISDVDNLPDWRRRLDRARKLIAELPQEAMFEEPDEFLEKLDVILEQITVRRTAILATKEG